MTTYVIEHMESDESTGTFPPWVTLEYRHMLTLATPSPIIFSSLSSSSIASLKDILKPEEGGDAQTVYRAETRSVRELMDAEGIPLERVCLLDPKAKEVLSIGDREKFDWFLFGGILGDDPPRDRTSELRDLGFPTRHLNPTQLTTDTAVLFTKLIVQDQIPIEDVPFIEYPTIRFNESESVEMPFRYVKNAAGEPILPKGMRKLLFDDMDKAFE